MPTCSTTAAFTLEVPVCEGSYGILRWRKQNVTVIELTDRCIRGIPNRAFGLLRRRPPLGDPSFEIASAAIVSAQLLPQPAGLDLMRVLDFKYRVTEQVREKSIASFNGRMEKAFAILQRCAPVGLIARTSQAILTQWTGVLRGTLAWQLMTAIQARSLPPAQRPAHRRKADEETDDRSDDDGRTAGRLAGPLCLPCRFLSRHDERGDSLCL